MIISYQSYLNKVYGCLLGKCAGGNAGGPAEGRKELLDFSLASEILNSPMPNDDLDLQLLWIDVLNEKGINLTSKDLGQKFFDCVPYAPGEYAAFKKNFGRGIYPPLSGSYNNRYYKNGMGCPIRSEVWACSFPMMKERAYRFVEMDGCLDHEKDSILAEQFMTGMECDAFANDNIAELIQNNMELIPHDTKIYRVIRDTVDWFYSGHDWKYIRSLILKFYGHPDCTNLYQNMGMIVLVLLSTKSDFYETVRMSVACGYDTDCICASAASVIGIILGAEALMENYHIIDTGIAAGIKLHRKYDSIKDVALAIANIGVSLCGDIISDAPDCPLVPSIPEKKSLMFGIDYNGNPVITYCGTKQITVLISNNTDTDIISDINITAPNGLKVSYPKQLILSSHKQTECSIIISCPAELTLLHQCNIFILTLVSTETEYTYDFGIVGADVWRLYGPFFENNQDLSEHNPYQRYYDFLKPEVNMNREDIARNYHLNQFADIKKEYLKVPDFFKNPFVADMPQKVGEIVQITEDLFDLSELHTFIGPNVSYLYRELYSPEDRLVDIALGASAPFRIWVNDELLGGDDNCGWWTAENRHFHKIQFNKGKNTLILKLAQISETAKFSLLYRIPDTGWSQYYDFASICK